MYRRRLITIKTKTVEHFVISVANADSDVEWCPDCASDWLSLADAEITYGLSLVTLGEQIKSGHIHFSKTVDGDLLICRRSIESKNLNGESQ